MRNPSALHVLRALVTSVLGLRVYVTQEYCRHAEAVARLAGVGPLDFF